MKADHEITLPLDERNLGHVFSALAMAGLAAEICDVVCDTRCWWDDCGFRLRLPIPQTALFEQSDLMLRGLRWVAGLGVDEKLKIAPKAHHGVPQRAQGMGTNPFISFAAGDAESSPLKTFAGRLDPWKILTGQIGCLKRPPDAPDWLRQRAFGVASWGFDSSVGSHAYDLGFSSNDEGSGDADPIYPAIELLSLAGASFFSEPHTWQTEEESFHYVIWHERLPLALAPLAAAGCADGVIGIRYALATRGSAYGKGAAYHYFPEGSPVSKPKIT